MQPVLVSASNEIIVRRTYNPKLDPFVKNNVVIDEWNLDDYFLRLDGSNTMVGPINFEDGRYFLQVTFHRSQLQVTQYLPENSIKTI